MIQLPPDTPWFVVMFVLAASTAVWLARRYIESSFIQREAQWKLEQDKQRGEWELERDKQRSTLEQSKKDADERTMLLQTMRDLIAQIAQSNKIAGEERQQARIERATYIAAFDKSRGDINEIRKALLASQKVLRDIARKLSISEASDSAIDIDTSDLDTTIQLLQSDAQTLQIDVAAAKRASQTAQTVKDETAHDDEQKP